MAELTPCGRILLTQAELLNHKSAAYRDGYGDGLGSAAAGIDAVGEHALAELLREGIPLALAQLRDTAAQMGVELAPWRRL